MAGDVQAGDRIVGFTPVLPVDDETCRRNIAENIGRDLPEAIVRRRLDIIANGPSARLYFERRADTNPSLALNGALGLFETHGRRPTFWAACDPQGLVADFLPADPPRNVRYFVASICHPSVFDKLRGLDVVRWHTGQHEAEGRLRIAPSCSVTMTAAWLFIRMGYTDLEFWGWDGCWVGDEHHAGQGLIGEDEPVNINFGGTQVGDEIVGGRTFKTSRSWAAESLAAEQFFHMAHYLDLRVTVHGDGMMKIAQDAVLKERAECSQSSSL